MPEEKPVHIGRREYPELTYLKATTSYETPFREDDAGHLLDYWRVIVARRWTVIAVVFTVLIATLIWTFKQDPLFQAGVSIQIDRENPNILSFKDIYQVESADDDALRTQFEVLKSRALARRVIENLKLEKKPEFQVPEAGIIGSYVQAAQSFFVPSSPKESDRSKKLIDDYLDNLDVQPVRLSRLVNVTFRSKNPDLAALIVNAHAKHFIEQNFQVKWEATQQASDFLKQQLVSLKQNLEKAEDKLQAYGEENHILFTEQGRNTAIEKLQQLEEEYTKALADRFQKESYQRLVLTGNTEALPQLMNNQLLASLMNQVTQLQREESELAVTFSEDYPARKRKRSQIDQTERAITDERLRIVKTVQAEHAAAVERESLLTKALEQQRDEVNRVNLDIIQYNILKREADSNKQLYEGLLGRLNEAGVSADLRASNIRIVDRAEVPEKPVRPKKALNIVLGTMFGLLAGIGLAFFQEYLDDTIKTAEDIARHLNLSTLGLIPKMASLRSGRKYAYGYGNTRQQLQAALVSGDPRIDIVTHESPTSLVAEAYRSIRTSLLLSSPDKSPKTVLVSSAAPSEGKTVTAINTAISLTQIGARVLLIDGDMRKPRISAVFDMKRSAGLSSILTGTAELKAAIQQSQIPNLFVVPCGPIPPNPAELIVANRFKQLLEVLQQYFDYIVLDSPPISNVSDARILASLCDATILVVKGLSTSRRQAIDAVECLHDSHARIAGVVLNDLDVRVGSYYSHYSSKYRYSYSAQSQSN